MIQTLAFFLGVTLPALALYLLFKRGSTSVSSFNAAGRVVPAGFAGLWMAVAWTWGTTFLYPAQLAYQQGMLGFGIYAIGNSLGLLLAMLVLSKISEPDKKYSIVEAMEERYGTGTKWIMTGIVTSVWGLYALSAQFIAAKELLHFAMGWDRSAIVIACGLAMLLTVVLGGLFSSAFVDLIKLVMIGMFTFVLVPLVIIKAGGAGAVAGGFAGHAVTLPQVSESSVLFFVLTLGIPVLIALISAGPIDQSLAQRYFAVRKNPKWALYGSLAFGGLVLFPCFLFAVASLGFLGANKALGITVGPAATGDPRIVGFITATTLVPWLATVLVLILALAFVAMGDTALNASSSVIGTDVYKRWWKPQASEVQQLRAQRGSMLVFILIAITVALQNIDLLTLTVAFGIIRSPLMFPIVFGAFVSKERLPGGNHMAWGILVAIIVTLLLYFPGKYCLEVRATWCSTLPLVSPTWYVLAGSVAGWLISFTYCVWFLVRSWWSMPTPKSATV